MQGFDAKKYRIYLTNFGEFYENQVEHASSIVLSHTDGMPQQKLDPAKPEDREAYMSQELEKMWWEPAKVQMKAAVREWDDLDRLLDECDAAWPKVRALAKPVPHRYVLEKCGIVK